MSRWVGCWVVAFDERRDIAVTLTPLIATIAAAAFGINLVVQ